MLSIQIKGDYYDSSESEAYVPPHLGAPYIARKFIDNVYALCYII